MAVSTLTSDVACNFNSDMQGFATRLTTFVTQVCLAIIVKWSPPDMNLDGIADSFLLQSYSVILATFLNIGRQQLSEGDVGFSVFLTFLSPMGLYFVFSNTRDLWRNWRRLFKRKYISKLPRRVLILLIPWLVINLQLITGFPNSFRDNTCQITDQTSRTWVLSDRVEIYVLLITLGCWILVACVYTILHRNDIFVEARRLATNKSRWAWLRRVKFTLLFPPSWIIADWTEITRSHHWVLLFPIIFVYEFWAFCIRPFGVETGYVMTYGQILALFTAIGPVLQTLILIYDRRHDISEFSKRFPKTFVDELVFLTTARRNPWKPAAQEYLPVGMPSDTVGIVSQSNALKIEPFSGQETAAPSPLPLFINSHMPTDAQNDGEPPITAVLVPAPTPSITCETDSNRSDTTLPPNASTDDASAFTPTPTLLPLPSRTQSDLSEDTSALTLTADPPPSSSTQA